MPYLESAQAAVNFVNGLGLNSNNRGEDLDGTSEKLSGSLGKLAIRKNHAMYMETLDILNGANEPIEISTLVIPAAVSRQIQFGNCEARAARAFIYLAEQDVRPLELMSVGDDHVFLVVGRTSGNIPDYASWNDDAAISDPWANAAYLKGELGIHLTDAPLAEVVGEPPIRISQCGELLLGANWPPANLAAHLTRYNLA